MRCVGVRYRINLLPKLANFIGVLLDLLLRIRKQNVRKFNLHAAEGCIQVAQLCCRHRHFFIKERVGIANRPDILDPDQSRDSRNHRYQSKARQKLLGD
jgi:hypothetical protein